MDGTSRTLSHQYDAAGNRTRITHPDGNWFGTLYDAASQPYYLDANGAGGIAYASYYSHGGISTLQRLGSISGFAWDTVLRPQSRAHYFAGTIGNSGGSYGYNPAGQIDALDRTDAYAESSANANVASSANGLNQITASGSATLTYDADGNLASDGTRNFAYDIENRMISATGTPTSALTYDPLGRLYQVSSVNGTTRFLYDGHTLVGEHNTSGTLLRRHIHWPGVDVPTATYEGSNLSTMRQLFSDHLGSVVAIADGNGANLVINRYDEYGVAQGGSVTGRFGYTGQMWLPEVGMYYYRARIYDPNGGRFMQADPIGYGDGMNLYAYVRNDPANFTDPLGLGWWPSRVEYKRNDDGTYAGVGLGGGPTSDGGTRDADGSRFSSTMSGGFIPMDGGGGGIPLFGGQTVCTNCGTPAQTGPNNTVVVTGPIYQTVPIQLGTNFVTTNFPSSSNEYHRTISLEDGHSVSQRPPRPSEREREVCRRAVRALLFGSAGILGGAAGFEIAEFLARKGGPFARYAGRIGIGVGIYTILGLMVIVNREGDRAASQLCQ